MWVDLPEGQQFITCCRGDCQLVPHKGNKGVGLATRLKLKQIFLQRPEDQDSPDSLRFKDCV